MYFYNESLIFSLHSLHKYNKLYLRTNKKVSIMQAMFKSELAKLAGVSSRTFRRYLATRRAILTAMGVSPFARKLPPQAVHYISEDYCIDLPSSPLIKWLLRGLYESLSKGRRQQGCKHSSRTRRAKARERYQNLCEGWYLPVANCILPLGEGLGWGNVSFGSFSLRQRK